ncbi:MAG: polyphosphate kinase 2 family protein [Ignavibacteriales bacterium]|nr:polyphosphate kinase 2 family protein [Ignavibacteriales bacterium]
MDLKSYRAPYKKEFSLKDFATDDTGKFESKEEAERLLSHNVKRMAELQDALYAHDRYALLLIFQAMDAAGKDGAIKHVMSGLNPQGTQVFSFKQPSAEELDHDYLWRVNKSLPERGRIGIFNRSHYEEILVVRVHNYLEAEKLPEPLVKKDIWKTRFRQFRDYERYLYENGVQTVKFFLNISKDEQKKRFLKRLDDPTKNWKFSTADLKERGHWNDYQKVYAEAIAETSTKYAPWYIVPADKKWFARLLISTVIVKTLERMKPEYPKVSEDKLKNLEGYRKQLMDES